MSAGRGWRLRIEQGMELRIETNFADVQAKLRDLHRDVAGRALAGAVNKTLDVAKTAMYREIVSEYMVTPAYVKQRLRVRRASGREGQFTVEASLIGGDGRRRSANVIAFVERSTSLAEGRRRAKEGTRNHLFFKIKRRGGKKRIAGSFIGNKGRTVFRREGKGRLPIEPVSTIDVASMFNAKRINTKVIETIVRRFPDIFDREARFYLDRFNRTGK